ncbi:MAG: hypothetical protein AB8H86_29580 [Polyangiales bacterium]
MRLVSHCLFFFFVVACGGTEAPVQTLPQRAPASSPELVAAPPSGGPACFPEWARGAALLMNVRSYGDRRYVLGDDEREQGAWDMNATFRLRTAMSERGAHITQWDFSGWSGDALAPLTHASLYVLHRIRGIRLDAQGAVVAIDGAAEAKAEAEAVFATREGVPAGSVQTWELISTPEGLRGQAVQWWQLFAILSCADLDQWSTERVVSNDSAWMPGMEDVPVAVVASVEPVACPAGEEDCERRSLGLRPDASRTLGALRQQFAAQGMPTDRVSAFSVRRQAQGIFDAQGHPVELTLLNETTTVHSRPDTTETMTQIDTDTSVYRFARLPGPTLK